MTFQIFLLLTIILVVTILLISGRMRPDLVALLALVTLGLTGLVSPSELFSGFSRSAVITILALFIITDGLEKTGATQILGRQLRRLAGTTETRAIVAVMVTTATLSLVMNTIAAAAVLLPPVIGITRLTKLKPSKILLPLAYASLLGGMATLFTTANILVSSALSEQGLQGYGVLDFVPVGLPMAVAGIVYMATVGRRLLPEHSLGGENGRERHESLSETYSLQEAVFGVYVKPGSAMAGLTLNSGGWGKQLGLSVVGISRGGGIRLAPSPHEEVLEGDVILFTGTIKENDLARYGLVATHDPTWKGNLISSRVSLVEVVLAPRSTFAGKTLRDINFRERYNLTALALWRQGKTFRENLADITLQYGDALLLQGTRDRIKLLRNDPAFIILEEDIEDAPPDSRAFVAVGLTVAAIVLSAANVLPIAEATFSAALFMVLLGCLSMDEAYQAIEWRAIFLIAGMLPIGFAMASTGTAGLLGNLLTSLVGGGGWLALAGGLFILTMLLTQVMGGQATAVVMAPIAIAAAQGLGADPRAIGMAVAMGCSTAFLTPFGHPTNILVMGPGGYSIKDYARVGLPLTVLLFVVLLLSLAVFWRV